MSDNGYSKFDDVESAPVYNDVFNQQNNNNNNTNQTQDGPELDQPHAPLLTPPLPPNRAPSVGSTNSYRPPNVNNNNTNNNTTDDIIPSVGEDPRANLATDLLRPSQTDAPGDGNLALLRLLRGSQIFCNTIEIVVIIIIISLYWNLPCHSLLRGFLITRLCFDVGLIAMYIYLFNTRFSGHLRTVRKVLQTADYCMVLWVTNELGEVKQCKTTSPGMWGLSIALICVTWVIALAPLFLLLLICCCLPCMVRWLGHLIEGMGVPVGATERQIEELPHYQWTPELFEEHQVKGNSNECAICLTDFEAEQEVIIYGCKHAFHAQCAVEWAKLNRTCSICRADPFADVPAADNNNNNNTTNTNNDTNPNPPTANSNDELLFSTYSNTVRDDPQPDGQYQSQRDVQV